MITFNIFLFEISLHNQAVFPEGWRCSSNVRCNIGAKFLERSKLDYLCQDWSRRKHCDVFGWEQGGNIFEIIPFTMFHDFD